MFGTLKRILPYSKYSYHLKCACCNKSKLLKFSPPNLKRGGYQSRCNYDLAKRSARNLGWARHRIWGWRCPKHNEKLK